MTAITNAVRRDLSAATPGDACLVCIYGAELGKRWPLAGGAVVVGRASASDITLDQDSVSRAHAKFLRRGDVYVLSDLGSTNGTFVADEQIKERVLRDGDRVRIGRTIFKFLTGKNIETSYHEEIYRLVTVDGLTQIYNRRYFDETLEREITRCRRGALTLALLLVDLDHFKKVNDTHGHVVGDAVLRQLASELGPMLTMGEVFARTGGEEFGVIMPGFGLREARDTAERLRRAVASARFGTAEVRLACTISLGAAELSPGESAKGIYERADAALYRAKENGRNRVSE